MKELCESPLLDLVNTRRSVMQFAALLGSDVDPAEIFRTVTVEALRHFGRGTARLIRYEENGAATVLANKGSAGPHVRVGHAWEGYPPGGLTATVRETGRAARVDDYEDIPGADKYLHEGLRSAVGMPIHVGNRVWGLLAVGTGDAPLPADTEQRMTEYAKLATVPIATAQSRSDLTALRAASVAAGDKVRREIERNIHDGAQQHLVSHCLRLRSTAEAVPDSHPEIREALAEVAAALADVMDDLRTMSRGSSPVVGVAGLAPALRTLARRSAVPVRLHLQLHRSLPRPVEICAYYVVSEALANCIKHARATVMEVSVSAGAPGLVLSCRDDGVGGADAGLGSGLTGLMERVADAGGTLTVDSAVGAGTTVWCRIPLTAERHSGRPGGQERRHGM